MNDLSCTWIIATLGSSKRLEKIYSTAFKVSEEFGISIELIFSLPPEVRLNKKENYNKQYKKFKFLILNSDHKGQVFQRYFALKKAKNKMVIFSDDDIEINHHSVYKLLKIKSKLPKNSVIAPKLIPYNQNNFSFYPDNLMIELGFNSSFIKKFLNIRKIGFGEETILGIGTGFQNIGKNKLCENIISCGVKNIDENLYEVDWLPGAFTLHTKENLFLIENYFWKGKAYAEDYFYSISLKRKNIKYYLITDIFYKCELTFSNNSSLINKLKIFLSSCIRIYQVQKKLNNKIINLRLMIYFCLIILFKVRNYLKKLINNFKFL